MLHSFFNYMQPSVHPFSRVFPVFETSLDLRPGPLAKATANPYYGQTYCTNTKVIAAILEYALLETDWWAC